MEKWEGQESDKGVEMNRKSWQERRRLTESCRLTHVLNFSNKAKDGKIPRKTHQRFGQRGQKAATLF